MTGTGTQIGTSMFNSSRDKAEYVGYMYTVGEQHGNSTSSGIKTTIDNWYKTTTLETDATIKSLVADQIFCNDRNASTSSTGTSGEISGGINSITKCYYAAYVRLRTNKSPKLNCTTESDKFTSKHSSIGNKVLDYPVGLITADEVAMAGGKSQTRNSSYYLYTNQYYWSGSPSDSNSSASAYEFYVHSSGTLVNGRASDSNGARPVVSLSSNAKLSGDGTYNNVYTVS